MKINTTWDGSAGSPYTIPNTVRQKGLLEEAIQSNEIDFAFAQGRYPVGDWIVRGKKLRLDGWIIGNTPTHVKTVHERFRNAFLAERHLYYNCLWFFPLDDDWSYRFNGVKMKAPYEQGGFNRVIKVTVDLVTLFDALEYKVLTAEGPTNIDADPDTIATTPAVSVDTPARITITAATTLANGFTIEQSVGGVIRKTMIYAGALVNNDVVVIDGINGVVTLNSANDINNFNGQYPTAMAVDINGAARTHTFTITGTGYAGTWATFKYEYRKNRVGSLSD